jgi:hypothetical protein
MDRPSKAVSGRLPSGWILVGVLGMLFVAASSGIKPWGAAIAGAFLPADLAADVAAAHLFVQRTSPYGPAIRPVHAAITGLPLTATLPYFPHPPFSLLISFPFAFMSFGEASVAWFAATLVLIFALAVLLHRVGGHRGSVGRLGVGTLWLLLLAWPPVLYNLEKGQWSVLLAVLLALAWRAVTRGDSETAAVWAALAASIKVFPVLLGTFFLIRSVRVAGWFVVTGIVLLAVPVAWIGFESFPAFLRESSLNLPYWESFPLVMFSLHGAITRALVGGQWAQPFVHAPVLARVIETTLLSGLVGVAVWTTVQARRGMVDYSLAFLAWLVLLPVLNPLSMGHNGVLLALPIVVVAHTLRSAGRPWHRWAWAVALTLVSIPNQTIWSVATLPVPPLQGLRAALPACGALLLYTITVSLAHAPGLRTDGPRRGGSGKILLSHV